MALPVSLSRVDAMTVTVAEYPAPDGDVLHLLFSAAGPSNCDVARQCSRVLVAERLFFGMFRQS